MVARYVTHRIVFRADAEAELAEAIEWHETRGRGLGAALLRAIEATLANIQRNPFAYPEVMHSVRRAPVRRFPYSVIYRVGETDIVVMACFHGHRDPRHWEKRAAKP